MAIQNNDTSYLDIEAKIVALLELILKELNTLLRSVAKRAGALSNQTATNRQTTRPAYGGLRTYEASTTVGDLMCINPYDREHIVNLIIKCQKRLSAAEKLIERAERDVRVILRSCDFDLRVLHVCVGSKRP